MPKDPWQRANELSRLNEADLYGRLPPQRPRDSRGGLFALILLLVLAAAGGLAWYYRDKLLPEAEKAPLPAPVKEAVHKIDLKLPDIDALDKGLGIGLRLGGDYKEVIAATREWQIEWKLSTMGAGHTRLTANGVEISCENDKIRTYTVDLLTVFSDTGWDPWSAKLKEAGYFPEQRYKDIAGADKAEGESLWLHRSAKLGEGKDVHPAYRLRFKGGQLVELLAAVEFASSADSGKVWDKFVPSDDEAAAARAEEHRRAQEGAGTENGANAAENGGQETSP